MLSCVVSLTPQSRGPMMLDYNLTDDIQCCSTSSYIYYTLLLNTRYNLHAFHACVKRTFLREKTIVEMYNKSEKILLVEFIEKYI